MSFTKKELLTLNFENFPDAPFVFKSKAKLELAEAAVESLLLDPVKMWWTDQYVEKPDWLRRLKSVRIA